MKLNSLCYKQSDFEFILAKIFTRKLIRQKKKEKCQQQLFGYDKSMIGKKNYTTVFE